MELLASIAVGHAGVSGNNNNIYKPDKRPLWPMSWSTAFGRFGPFMDELELTWSISFRFILIYYILFFIQHGAFGIDERINPICFVPGPNHPLP